MALDITFTVIGALLTLAGIVGCIAPVVPGPVLGYTGLLLLQFTSSHQFTTQFMVVFAVLTVVAGILDYVIPIYGTRKFEGSKYGVWGCTVGLILGILFLFPLGIIIGPAAGAFAGELISGKPGKQAVKSAFGSFLGFLAGTVVKLALTLAMAYYFFMAVYSQYIV